MEIWPDRIINELADRTIKNYDFIKANCKKEGLNEVTELINSMYCLVVVPEEIFGVKRGGDFNSIFSSKEKNLKKYSSYHDINNFIDEMKIKNRIKYKTIDEYTEYSPVTCLLYNMRNALCHDNIGFLPVDSYGVNEITDIIFRGTKIEDENNIIFMMVLSVEQLENLMRMIAAFYKDIEKGKANGNRNEYIKYYERIKDDLNDFIGEYE